MKICEQCGLQNPTEAKFCRGCGHPFPANEPVSEETLLSERASVPAPSAVPTPSTPQPQAAAPQPASQPAPQPVYAAPQPAAVPQPQYQAQQQPTQPIAMPQQPPVQGAPAVAQPGAANAFFVWLWESFKHPSKRYATQAWWAIIPLVFNAFLMALTVYMWESKAVSAATNVGNGILGGLSRDFTGSSSYAPQIASPGVSISELFKFWVIFAALLYIIVLICFMGRKMLGEAQTTFSTIHVELAQKTMPMVALNLVAFLCALIGSGMLFLSSLLFMIGLTFIMAIPGAIVAQGVNARKLDKTWMWIFIMMLGGLILFVFFMIIAVAGVASAVSTVQSLL
ncbi:hypothetical protein CS006_05835 [Bifidobacterium primatium]|uniref:Zinc-ribbon domain-containing protein n=1 Tax=Bifidobacterium primatium TaxID=2045438 RepID=A0A2M9H9S5_9BIFI|nr:zinc ribbon domain-containing protein [Bifidobacterium primatium]PJM73547.1 hypothetical protein CS006_05835 [Bifidobacterium primatium]